MTTKRLRWLMQRLRAGVPTQHPVIVRRRPIMPKMINGQRTVECGYTFFRPESTFILINSGLDEVVQEETLIHEYAHAVSGVPGHGADWGIAYARVWRAYEPK